MVRSARCRFRRPVADHSQRLFERPGVERRSGAPVDARAQVVQHAGRGSGSARRGAVELLAMSRSMASSFAASGWRRPARRPSMRRAKSSKTRGSPARAAAALQRLIHPLSELLEAALDRRQRRGGRRTLDLGARVGEQRDDRANSACGAGLEASRRAVGEIADLLFQPFDRHRPRRGRGRRLRTSSVCARMRSKVAGLTIPCAMASTLASMARISRSSPARRCADRKRAGRPGSTNASTARSSRAPSSRIEATRSLRSRIAPSSATTALRGARSARLRDIAAISARKPCTSSAGRAPCSFCSRRICSRRALRASISPRSASFDAPDGSGGARRRRRAAEARGFGGGRARVELAAPARDLRRRLSADRSAAVRRRASVAATVVGGRRLAPRSGRVRRGGRARRGARRGRAPAAPSVAFDPLLDHRASRSAAACNASVRSARPSSLAMAASSNSSTRRASSVPVTPRSACAPRRGRALQRSSADRGSRRGRAGEMRSPIASSLSSCFEISGFDALFGGPCRRSLRRANQLRFMPARRAASSANARFSRPTPLTFQAVAPFHGSNRRRGCADRSAFG